MDEQTDEITVANDGLIRRFSIILFSKGHVRCGQKQQENAVSTGVMDRPMDRQTNEPTDKCTDGLTLL